jgi:hypothetical protein
MKKKCPHCNKFIEVDKPKRFFSLQKNCPKCDAPLLASLRGEKVLVIDLMKSKTLPARPTNKDEWEDQGICDHCACKPEECPYLGNKDYLEVNGTYVGDVWGCKEWDGSGCETDYEAMASVKEAEYNARFKSSRRDQ